MTRSEILASYANDLVASYRRMVAGLRADGVTSAEEIAARTWLCLCEQYTSPVLVKAIRALSGKVAKGNREALRAAWGAMCAEQ